MTNPRYAVLLLLLVLLAGVSGPVVGANPWVDSDGTTIDRSDTAAIDNSDVVVAGNSDVVVAGNVDGAALAQQTGLDGETVTRIDIRSDGDATVSIEVRTRLEDEEDEAAFERVRRRIDENRTEEEAEFQQAVEGLVDRAENETERNMSASAVTIETEVVDVPRRWGIVRYQFEWAGFAAVDGESVRVDGVLSGYLLADGDALVIAYPETYEVSSVDPQPDETDPDRVVWRGPTEFSSTEPRLALVPQSEGLVEDESTSRAVPSVLLAGLFILLTIAAVVTWSWYRSNESPIAAISNVREDESGPPRASGVVGDAGTESGVGSERGIRGETGVDGERRGGETGGGGETGIGRGNGTDEESAIRSVENAVGAENDVAEDGDLEPLADTERILHILSTEDGRVRQQDLVSRTGWSETKVSKVTSALESEGRIEKLRIGRENVIGLVDEE